MKQTLVQRLKPWVTTFSAAVPMKYKHGDKVCIGGEIKSILDFQKMMGSTVINDTNQNPIGICVQMTIDDDVGTTELIFVNDIFKVYNEKYNFTKGMVVLAEGKVWNDKKETQESTHNNTVMCWKIYPLPED